VALVTAPALGGPKALAAASSQESKMAKLAAALGVTAGANETALLGALNAGFVPRAVHDEAVSKLSASETKLKDIEDANRKARVDALIEGALKEKKIMPAEKDHYAQLCATESGFESVKALLAAKSPALGKSGLDEKKPEEGAAILAALSPTQLAAKANKMVESGESADFLSAMTALRDSLSREAA
jgi:phage I-like protein